MAKVSASAADAKRLRYLNQNAVLVTNAERRLHVALKSLINW